MGLQSRICRREHPAGGPSNGAAVSSTTLQNPASLNAGGSDRLVITLALPTGAGNEFQGKSSALSITFTGSQKTGTAR
jgi:hypothetical protein